MRVEMIAVGDELLDGRVADRNSHALGQLLRDVGHPLRRVQIVADEVGDITEALDRSAAGAAVVISGGLGCTDDDRTREAIARWVGSEVVEDDDAMEALRLRLEGVGRRLRPSLRRHACRVATSAPIDNPVGLAIGMSLRHAGRRLFVLPGVPSEFVAMASASVVPALLEGEGRGGWRQRRLQIAVLGESRVEATLTEGLDLDDDITLSICAHDGWVTLGFGGASSGIERRLDVALSEAARLLGPYVIGEGDAPLAARVGEALIARGETLATAESCTGGLIGHLVTEIPGSSAYFLEGAVTYSNAAKMRALGVPAATLDAHGAVSEASVRAMAEGVRREAGSDWSVATSGIAGPGGGSPEKPVGLVHMAVAGEGQTWHRRLIFAGRSRRRVKLLTAHSALSMLFSAIEGRPLWPGAA